MTEKVKEYLDCFMVSKTDKIVIPQVLNDVGTMASVLGSIFPEMKVGEIANNLLFQMTRLCSAFGTELVINIDEVKKYYTHYMTLVSNELKKNLDKIRKENEKEQKKE